ncbi:MAG TPA: hypothetical protein VKU19_13115 [Bryobacteraceae bacterium]|nr:hypothetical protein [Bryobacteraceae bacterium]
MGLGKSGEGKPGARAFQGMPAGLVRRIRIGATPGGGAGSRGCGLVRDAYLPLLALGTAGRMVLTMAVFASPVGSGGPVSAGDRQPLGPRSPFTAPRL